MTGITSPGGAGLDGMSGQGGTGGDGAVFTFSTGSSPTGGGGGAGGGGGGSSFAPGGSTGTDTTGTPSVTISYTVVPALAVTTTSLPGGVAGTAYSQTLAATGGLTPYTWSVSGGSLPAGLNLNSATGEISGTPASAGASSFTIEVTDAESPAMTATQPLSLTVTPAPLAVTTTSLPGATLGSAYSAALAATGGTPPYTWSVTAGSLPPGLSLSSAGTISGTPAVAGTYPVTVQAADSASPRQTATARLSVTVGGCTTSITGSHTGQIVVGKGQFVCIGPNASQNGAITVNSGGGLSVVSSTLTGGISAGGAVSLGLSGSTINGSVSLTGGTGPSLVSGNTIVGSLSCSGNNPPPSDNGQPNKVSGKSTGQCSALG